jgi:hypothetical protein
MVDVPYTSGEPTHRAPFTLEDLEQILEDVKAIARPPVCYGSKVAVERWRRVCLAHGLHWWDVRIEECEYVPDNLIVIVSAGWPAQVALVELDSG